MKNIKMHSPKGKFVAYVICGVLFICLSMNNVYAQSAPDYGGTQRICQAEDLVGHLFLQVDFSETPPRSLAHMALHFRYNYLTFFQANNYENVQSNRPVQTPQMALKRLAGGKGLYTLSKDGVLTFIKNDRIVNTYRCIAILKPQGDYIPGDLVLNGYTRKKKSAIYRLYRRWY